MLSYHRLGAFLSVVLATILLLEVAADDQSNGDNTNGALVQFDVQLGPSKTGSFFMEVHPDWAPLGAERFLNLVDGNGPTGEPVPDISGDAFWKGLRFFRVVGKSPRVR